MKVAWMVLHYGYWLREAVEAMYPQVDKIVIAYTDQPSQGFGTANTPPQLRDDLLKLIDPYMDKILWVDGVWDHEGHHCDTARNAAAEQGGDWLVRFDSDEIFQPGSVDRMIAQAETKPEFDMFRVPFLHFWRSLNRVCRDAQFPIRLERPNASRLGWIDSENEELSVLHLGYAQPTEYIQYKMEVQAHHNEWRQDWFSQKWVPNAQTDLHPVVFDFWNAEDFDPKMLPDSLRKLSAKEIIE